MTASLDLPATLTNYGHWLARHLGAQSQQEKDFVVQYAENCIMSRGTTHITAAEERLATPHLARELPRTLALIRRSA